MFKTFDKFNCLKNNTLNPVCNVEKFNGNYIESLLRQDIPEQDYEVIIMDDGSSNSSIAIVNIFVKPKLYYI